MVEIGPCGSSIVSSPQFDVVRVVAGPAAAVECNECRLEQGSLLLDQGQWRLPRSLEQSQLQLELDSYLPDVTHRLIEPAFQMSLARRCHPMNHSQRPGATWLGVDRFGEPCLDQATKGAVGEGATNSEHSSYPTFRREFLRDCEPMSGTFGEKSEDCVLCERNLVIHVAGSDIPNVFLGWIE